MKTYDSWKTTNPADEYLGPEPDLDQPDEDEPLTFKQWLVWNHILHVNHWWGFSVRGWHIFWAWGRPHITRDYPHTEN